MAAVESRYVTRKMNWHANFTELNHLGSNLITKPEKIGSKIDKLFTAYQYSDNPFSASIVSKSKERTLGTREWEWELKTASSRPLIVVRDANSGDTTKGFGRQEFPVILDEPWYKYGDVVRPGNSRYQCRIASNPVKEGNGYRYMFRMTSDNDADYVPSSYFSAGSRWVKIFAQYGEGAVDSGSTQYSFPIMLKNGMGKYRKQYKVTGDVANEVLAVKIPDSNGNYHTGWINYAEVEYWKQWYQELEAAYWYSRHTKTVLDSTGRPVQSGPGIQEMLEDSHRHNYSVLTAKLIEEYLMDVFYSRISPGTSRNIEAYTGEFGMILFHRAMQDLLDKHGWLIANQNFNPVQGASSPMHSNSYSLGYQFVEYKMQNGASLKLVHQPLYDNRNYNFEMDPVTGYPIESMRFTFLDFAKEDMTSNIEIVTKSNSLKLGYVAGLVNPYGVANKTSMAHSGDFYEMHIQKECGVHIADISRCGELILSRN
jgi:hypothetical protein